MKKAVLAIAIVVVLITCGIVEQVFVHRTLDELEVRADNIYQSLQAKEYATALKATHEMQVWWYDRRDWLEFLCPNNDIKEIVREMSELEGSQLAMMYDDSVTRANVLIHMARNSRNLLDYKWKNVL